MPSMRLPPPSRMFQCSNRRGVHIDLFGSRSAPRSPSRSVARAKAGGCGDRDVGTTCEGCVNNGDGEGGGGPDVELCHGEADDGSGDDGCSEEAADGSGLTAWRSHAAGPLVRSWRRSVARTMVATSPRSVHAISQPLSQPPQLSRPSARRARSAPRLFTLPATSDRYVS